MPMGKDGQQEGDQETGDDRAHDQNYVLQGRGLTYRS